MDAQVLGGELDHMMTNHCSFKTVIRCITTRLSSSRSPVVFLQLFLDQHRLRVDVHCVLYSAHTGTRDTWYSSGEVMRWDVWSNDEVCK